MILVENYVDVPIQMTEPLESRVLDATERLVINCAAGEERSVFLNTLPGEPIAQLDLACGETLRVSRVREVNQ